MRREFHPILLDYMRKDSRIVLITADLGYKMFDAITAEFPNRFYNVGASEQLMLGVGIGMAEERMIPICYSITPFLLYRGAEWIRNYLQHEKCPVKLLGGGRGNDYIHDGISHFAGDDKLFLSIFPDIECFWPETIDQLKIDIEKWLYNKKPSYLNLKR